LHGVFKSTDGAKTWRFSGQGLTSHAFPDNLVPNSSFPPTVQALAIDPVSPATVYAGTSNGGVFKSVDGGASWNPADQGIPVDPGAFNILSLAVDPLRPGTLYAGAGARTLYKSTDGAATWSPIGTSFDALTISSGSDTIYAGGTGLHKSVDGGQSWVTFNLPPFNGAVSAIVIDPFLPDTIYAGTQFGGIFRSRDAGATWSPLNNGIPSLPGGGPEIVALTIGPRDPLFLLALLVDGRVFQTRNAGESWSPAVSQDEPPVATTLPRPGAVAIDPRDPPTAYYGTTTHLHTSHDFGATWSLSDTGISNLQVVLAADPQSDTLWSSGWEDMSATLFRGGNRGATWEPSVLASEEVFVNRVAFHPSHPDVLYAYGDGILKSTDGGLTWSVLQKRYVDNGESKPLLSFAIDATDPAILYAGSIGLDKYFTRPGGVFRSTDGGATWSLTFRTLDPVESLAIDPARPSTLYAGTWHGVFKTTDSGANWLPVLGGVTISVVRVDPRNSSVIYAGSGDWTSSSGQGVFKSTDGGATWNPVNNGLTSLVVLDLLISPGDSAVIYAATFIGGVFKSRDAGISWQPMNDGLVFPMPTSLALDPTGVFLYAGSANLGAYVYQIQPPRPAVALAPRNRVRGARAISRR
jgi:photosystem II stability/assembly factor-like uncharacterized protein